MQQTITDLLRTYPIISDQVSRDDIALILTELEAIINRNPPGDVVEFGCYIGTASLFIQRLLDQHTPKRTFHVYDSFAGLPAKTIADASIIGENFKAGELAISKKQFIHEFKRAGLSLPVIHKGWFNDLTDRDLPNTIAFAFLDGDFYESLITSLRLVWPRMSQGGTILIDDYGREALPGVERAVRDFFRHQLPPMRISHNIAILSV